MIMLIGPRHCRAFTGALRGAHDSDCAPGVARSNEGCFSLDRELVDSWTLARNPCAIGIQPVHTRVDSSGLPAGSPQLIGPMILPGFMMLSGSSAFLIERISDIASPCSS